MTKARNLAAIIALAVGLPTLTPATTYAAKSDSSTSWSGFLHDRTHSSYAASETAITPANASTLVQKWHFLGAAGSGPGQPPPGYYASPTVVDGAVFIGSNTGWFYKLNETTGAVMIKYLSGISRN